MADELNTPTHRWYQRRYNIALSPNEVSPKWILAAGIAKIDAWIASISGASAYAVNGFDPALVFDFVGNYFRKGSEDSTLAAATTYTGASNGTMTDSDGLIKWKPHNLLKYSEQFDNAAWGKTDCSVTANAVTAPDGTTTADKLSIATINSSFHFTDFAVTMGAFAHTASAFLKAGEITSASIFLSQGGNVGGIFNLTTGAVTSVNGTGNTANMVDVGDGWYLCSVTNDGSASVSGIRLGIADGALAASVGVVGEGIYAWGAHLYRSDLGGMTDNPVRSDSYVPTTSAAVYLPRTGNHVYNGTAWVNEGLLLESEARTNLVTYSNGFSSWTFVNQSTVAQSSPSPDGGSNAWLFEDDSLGGSSGNVYLQLNGPVVSASSPYTASIYVKAGNNSVIQIKTANDDAIRGGTFDISSQTFTPLASETGTVTDVGNGWYLCSTTWTSGADTSIALRVAFPTITRDGTNSIYIYGAQLEAGSTPSSYIPTDAGATVTRAAETLTVAAADMPAYTTAVSIQMDGLMTYASNGSFVAYPLSWINTASNYTQYSVFTGSGQTGKLYLYQRETNSGLDNVTTANNSLSGGINEPFNFAGRHGSTFINVAIDGTVSTANTTPTALPDLSATDFQIGTTFMGNVGKVRVWADDLGDTGIAEASE